MLGELTTPAAKRMQTNSNHKREDAVIKHINGHRHRRKLDTSIEGMVRKKRKKQVRQKTEMGNEEKVENL